MATLKISALMSLVLVFALGLRPVDWSERKQPATLPNIIFLLADDLRWDALGVAGNTIVKTPQIDRLARQGFYFKRAYVTSPVCCMSRASILTGQYTRRHGIQDFVTSFSDTALAQTYPVLLRKAGYRTGFIGKYGVGKDMPELAYDYWRGFPGQGNYAAQDAQGKPIHLTDLMGQQMDEFVRTNPSGKPFCLSVSFKAPHGQDGARPEFPYADRFAPMYTDKTLPTPVAAADSFYRQFPDWFRHDDKNEGRVRWSYRFANDSMYQQTSKSYYRLITGMDEVIGDLRQTLQKRGLASNTVIVFLSDNGFYVGEYGLAGKWYGHEASIRVPLIIYDPRRADQQGRTTDRYALNIDIAPTLLTMAGVAVPDRMQGRSLTQLMDSPAKPWRTAFFFEHLLNLPNLPNVFIPHSEGVIKDDKKLVRYFDAQQPADVYEQVFDLKADPKELTNLAGKPPGKAIEQTLMPAFNQLKQAAK